MCAYSEVCTASCGAKSSNEHLDEIRIENVYLLNGKGGKDSRCCRCLDLIFPIFYSNI